MKKKLILVVLVFCLACVAGCSNSKPIDTVSETQIVISPIVPSSDTSDVWKEVDPPEEDMIEIASMPDFNMDLQMSADFIFKGKIISHKNYEISYTDSQGIQQGPNLAALLQVQIKDPFLGKSPIDGNIITIYFPFSTDIPLDGSFVVNDGQEYIFFARVFGKDHLAADLKGTPYYKDEMEKHADMYISDNVYSLLPIENGKVIAQVQYDYEKRAIPLDTGIEKKDLAPKAFELYEEGPTSVYSVFSENDFERALQHFSK